MPATRSIRAALASAALVVSASPLAAQVAAGPARTGGPDAWPFALVPPPAVSPPPSITRPVRAPRAEEQAPVIDATREFARKVQPSPPHLYASIPLSAVLGLAGSVVGYQAGGYLLGCTDDGPRCSSGIDNGEYYSAALGLAAGSAAGAHLGGLRHDSRGRPGLTLLGAALGTLPLVFADKAGDPDPAMLASLGLAPVGAVLVDYLARRPRP
jgi:hypothetical protein